MQAQSLGFRTDLMVRRLSGTSITDRGTYLCMRTPDNPGFWWGNFLLIPNPVRAGERWDLTFATEFPAASHVAIGVDTADGDAGDAAAIAALGLVAAVDVVLTATRLADNGAPPAGVVTRPLDDDRDWAGALEVRLACDDDEPTDDNLTFMRRNLEESRRVVSAGHGAWFGAFVDGQVRASLGLISDGAGYARFQSVETHPAYRRQGLARALLGAAGRWGIDHLDSPTFVIVAEPDYVAIELYRMVGFVDTERQVQLQHKARPGSAD